MTGGLVAGASAEVLRLGKTVLVAELVGAGGDAGICVRPMLINAIVAITSRKPNPNIQRALRTYP